MKPGVLTALLQEVAASPEKREEEPLSLPPGTVVGRFEIIRELGRGGFGVVYEAKDRDLGRQVAVKVVRPGRITEEEGKVSREAEAIARLAHANLITLHEVGRSEHGPFLVFELLRGKTLDLRIEEGPLPVQEAVHIATEVARGLAHAHAEGVIHRDLKPANVFITSKGQVKILDFGMAHAFGRRRLSGGTPAYMAPEQWEDDPEDERTDVFALGVMLYRMLTGEYPFPEGQGRWSAEPATPRKLDVPGAPDLAELVEKMLDRTPKGRPRAGAAVLAALTPIEDGLRAKPADGSPPVHAKRRKATFGDLLAELKRRRVFRVMVGYGIFAFAVLQVSEPIMHGARLPDWVLTAVLVALAVGFPVAVILAWVFDLTAQGVKRTPSMAASDAVSFSRGRLAMLLLGVALLAATPGAAWYIWRQSGERGQGTAGPGATPSIAVLPFTDLSPRHDQEYFADGMAEEILNSLAQIEGLRVAGRTSAFAFKGKNEDLVGIAKKLRVGSILEGSVRLAGTRVRITAQLINAADGYHVWSQTYDRELTGIFAVQDEIARAVVGALKVKLLGDRRGPAPRLAMDPEAYRLYLLGRQLVRLSTAESYEKALAALRQAALMAPNDPRLRSQLALALWFYFILGVEKDPLAKDEWWVWWRGLVGDKPDFAKVNKVLMAMAEEAVALGGDMPEPWAVRGFFRHMFTWDGATAQSDLRHAISLAPGDVPIRIQFARVLATAGRLPEALEIMARVTEADPLSPSAWLWMGILQNATGQPEPGETSFQRGLVAAPAHAYLLRELGFSLLLQGKAKEALALAERHPVKWFRWLLGAMAQHQLGNEEASREALEQLTRGGVAWSYQIAQAHAWRGEKDLAMEWLERGYAANDPGMRYTSYDPTLRSLRDDPRFKALLRKMELPVD